MILFADSDKIGHTERLEKVTIGFGAFSYNAYAAALVVSCGLISCAISIFLQIQICLIA